jgi:hypothetical protein
MMIKKEKNLKAIKRTIKGGKLEQPVSPYPKLLGYGLMQNDVESVCNVYLKQHLIRIDKLPSSWIYSNESLK